MRITNFIGPKVRIEDTDLPRIAATIRVGEDHIHAIMDVEAGGSPSDSQGRLKMLFEPHWFYKLLGPGPKRDKAVAQGIAYANWRNSYPKDSYPRLLKAMAIDEEAALKSASWGRAQILGVNFDAAGYDNVFEMIEDFKEDEDNHIEAMVRFIIAKKLDDNLRARDWAGFAYGYNGPKYATHGYHKKLAERYAWWQKRKDTPWDGQEQAPVQVPQHHSQPEQPSTLPPEAGVTNAQTPAPQPAPFTEAQIEALQIRLRDLGYFEVGKVDKHWGPRTVAAIVAFQAQENIQSEPGVRTPNVNSPGVDNVTLQRLAIAQKRPVSPVREGTTADDLVAQGSTTVKAARAINWQQWGQIALGIMSAIVLTANTWQDTQLPWFVGPLSGMAGVPSWAFPLIQIALAFWTNIKSNKVIMARIESEVSGMHNGEPDPAPSPPVTQHPEGAQGLANVRLFRRAT